MSKVKKTRLLIKAIHFGGFCVGCLANALLVVLVCALGLLFAVNLILSIIIGSLFAYPLATIANKYANLGFKKILRI